MPPGVGAGAMVNAVTQSTGFNQKRGTMMGRQQQ